MNSLGLGQQRKMSVLSLVELSPVHCRRWKWTSRSEQRRVLHGVGPDHGVIEGRELGVAKQVLIVLFLRLGALLLLENVFIDNIFGNLADQEYLAFCRCS